MTLIRRGALGPALPLVLALTACIGGKKPATTEIRLALSGGDHAGTVVVTSEDVICTEGLVGEGSWGVQYTDPQLTTPLGSMQLIVPGHANDGTSSRFFLGVVFESFLAGVDHEIETREDAGRPAGSGMVRIEVQNIQAALTVTGQTADGIGISAKVRCHQVRRHAQTPRDTEKENREP